MLGRQFVKAVVSAVARPFSTLSSFSSRCCSLPPLSQAVAGFSVSLNLRRSLPPLVMALSTLSSGSSARTPSVPVPLSDLTLVGQDASVAIDQDLFESFSVDSLMELAGLSVAEATLKSFPPGAHKRVLVVVGPGNNGGDGLVAARHLRHFGYEEVSLFYPKQSDKPLFQHLLRQNQDLGNAIIESLEDPKGAIVPSSQADFDAAFDLVVDAIFGFSFRGTPREPFVHILELMSSTSLPVISVDVPSGWHVEDGPTEAATWEPDVLVSLTAPKLCTRFFHGKRHFLGGRFVPPAVAAHYNISIPSYQGAEQSVELEVAPRPGDMHAADVVHSDL